MKKRIPIAVLVTILSVGLAMAAVWYFVGFRQGADVTSPAHIRVYKDEFLTDELQQGETISWGAVSPGSNYMPLWIVNDGSVDCILQFNYNGDQMPGGWTESWDYDGSALTSPTPLMVTLNLTLPQDVGVGHYEWDSGIGCTQAPP